MTKVPKWFGEISAAELERIEEKTSEFEKKVEYFQKRESEKIVNRSPRLKCYTYTVVKR